MWVENQHMILCDVGNTSYHFLDESGKHYKKNVKDFDPASVKERVYYICVNPHAKSLLASLENWVDLSGYVDMKNYYDTMGIDRIVACENVQDGVIVDAGSAITVDVVKGGVFYGGYICVGVSHMKEAYANLSPALDYEINFDIDLDKLPKNSKDAISYGYLKPLRDEVLSHGLDVILTGGDATKLSKIFPHAKIDDELIFDSMKKIVRKILKLL